MTKVEIAELKMKLSAQLQKALANIIDGIYENDNDKAVNGISDAYAVLETMAQELKKTSLSE